MFADPHRKAALPRPCLPIFTLGGVTYTITNGQYQILEARVCSQTLSMPVHLRAYTKLLSLEFVILTSTNHNAAPDVNESHYF